MKSTKTLPSKTEEPFQIFVKGCPVFDHVSFDFLFSSFPFRSDRTPPQVTITSQPTSPSNQNSFTFRFSCGGTCSFQCSVAQMGSRPAFTQCNSNRYTASSLQNGLVYVFQVRGTDDVGNQGSSVNYTWNVGKKPV